MNIVSVGTLRRLIPALFVGGVLAFSFFAASPSLASSTNNCGVKGYGYHDHGKVCPNRPFPGQGKGVLRILASLGVSSETGSSARGDDTKKGKTHTESGVTAGAASDALTEDTTMATGVGNGHGKANGHSKANGNGRGHHAID